jgi:hypothetical protein
MISSTHLRPYRHAFSARDAPGTPTSGHNDHPDLVLVPGFAIRTAAIAVDRTPRGRAMDHLAAAGQIRVVAWVGVREQVGVAFLGRDQPCILRRVEATHPEVEIGSVSVALGGRVTPNGAPPQPTTQATDGTLHRTVISRGGRWRKA